MPPSPRDTLELSARVKQERDVLLVPLVSPVLPVLPVSMEPPEEEEPPVHPESCPRSTLTKRQDARYARPVPSDPLDLPVPLDPLETRDNLDNLDRIRSPEHLER